MHANANGYILFVLFTFRLRFRRSFPSQFRGLLLFFFCLLFRLATIRAKVSEAQSKDSAEKTVYNVNGPEQMHYATATTAISKKANSRAMRYECYC